MDEEREEPVGRFRDRMHLLRDDTLNQASIRIVLSQGCAGLIMEQVAVWPRCHGRLPCPHGGTGARPV